MTGTDTGDALPSALASMTTSATTAEEGWVSYPLTIMDTSFRNDVITLGWVVEGRADEEKLRLAIMNVTKRWRLLTARILKDESEVCSSGAVCEPLIYKASSASFPTSRSGFPNPPRRLHSCRFLSQPFTKAAFSVHQGPSGHKILTASRRPHAWCKAQSSNGLVQPGRPSPPLACFTFWHHV